MIHVSGLFLEETCKIFNTGPKIMNMKIVSGRAVGHGHKYRYLECALQQKSGIHEVLVKMSTLFIPKGSL